MLLRKSVVIAIAVGLAWSWCGERAEARKQYNDVFWMHYAEQLAAHRAVKCVACHEGPTKKVRNDYGKAFLEHLKGRDVKDPDAIKAALDKAAKEPSALQGKTFGDLIKEGKLPASKP
jgi:hypothetical protein